MSVGKGGKTAGKERGKKSDSKLFLDVADCMNWSFLMVPETVLTYFQERRQPRMKREKKR